MNSIVEVVCHHAQQYPDRPTIFFSDQVVTYKQLYMESERFARALKVWGLQSGDRVALFLDNSPTFVSAYLGIQLAGGIVVLVNTQYRQVELSHILTDAGVRLCVTSDQGAKELLHLSLPDLSTLVIVGNFADKETVRISCIPFTKFLLSVDSTSHVTLTLPQADDSAIIAYTSGTTGRAKGALLSQRNLLANIATVTAAWHWTDQDRLLLALPLFHAHGLMVGIIEVR